MPSPTGRQLKAGHTFRNYLEGTELSRDEAAQLFGVCSATITYWCRRGVGKNYVENVADVLGCTPREIAGKGGNGKGRSSSKVKSVDVEAKYPSPVSNNTRPRLRPELIVELARTPLTDEQADLLRLIITEYSETA